MKKVVEKKYEILTIIVSIMLVIIEISSEKLTPYDNLWVFGNIYKLSIGKIIYKDVNIIEPPLFFEILSLIFKIITPNYYLFSIIGIIMKVILLCVIYKIFKELKIQQKYCFVFTVLLSIINKNTILKNGPNYNLLAIIFCELGILNAIKKSKNYSMIQPIIIALCMLTNQKIAFGYIISYIIYECKKNNQKKQALKNIFLTIIIDGFIGAIFLIYQFLNGNLYNFINLCILGLGEFKGNFVIEIHLIKIIMCVTLSIVIIKIFAKTNKIDIEKMVILVIFGIGTTIITYPIFNEYHTEMATINWIILIMYQIYIVLEEILTENKINKFFNIIIVLIILTTIIITTAITIRSARASKYKQNLDSIFYGAIFEDEIKENIKKVNDYLRRLNTNNIKILSIYSMYYTLENDIDNGFFDMPLKGNCGKEGKEYYIKELERMPEDSIILVQKDDCKYKIYQFEQEVAEYIKNNYQLIDEIEEFDVYKK